MTATAVVVQTREAEAEALNARLSGMSYRAIAEHQSCSVGCAYARVQRAIKSIVPRESVDELRALEGERLEATIGRVLQIIATATNPKQVLDAATTLGHLQARKARLFGLDIPVTQHVEVTNVDEQRAALAEKLANQLDELAARRTRAGS